MGSKTLAAALGYQRASIRHEAECAKSVRELCKTLNIAKYFSTLVALVPQADLYVGAYSILIQIPVTSMKHMLDAVEAAEIAMGLEFDNTSDNASGGERHFSSSKEWRITIIGRVPLEATEGQGCQRIQTGLEIVERPVYELICTD